MPVRRIPRSKPKLVSNMYLQRSAQLVRRRAIRQILMNRYHLNGVNSHEELVYLLQAGFDITTTVHTVKADLMEMGAIKVKDESRPSISWWMLPAFNPNLENLRETLDTGVVEEEVAHKFNLHVIDIATVGNSIFVMTEPRAGYLVAYWLSWLRWPGILFVQEQLDGCVIHCVDTQTAMDVATQLTGDDPDAEGGEDEEEDDDEEEAPD
jgi:arginine repressor